MTLIGDLPWLYIGDGASAAAGPATAPRVRRYEVQADAGEVARVADGITATHAVLVLPAIVPMAVAATLSPDPALLGSGRVLLWPAQNEVTGEVARTHGLWVLPVAYLKEGAGFWLEGQGRAPSGSPLVVPQFAATLMCGRSPEAAFRSGFRETCGVWTAGAALSASLGADHLHGPWWGIGACRGLLGGDADRAWKDEGAVPLDHSQGLARWHALARQVRADLGLPVDPLTAAAAAALRQMRGNVVDAALWDRFAEDLADLGPKSARLQAAHALARSTLWGHATP